MDGCNKAQKSPAFEALARWKIRHDQKDAGQVEIIWIPPTDVPKVQEIALNAGVGPV